MNARPSPSGIIEARALGKDYAGRSVLDEVSLSVEPGSILGLLGRNGAGKSTLLRCMLGLVRPDRGEARVFGAAAQRLTDAHKAALAYVPQQPDSFGWMTVAGMLDFVDGLYPDWDRELVERLLRRWELDPRWMLAELSPGERQQVALIRALAVRPRLLVLDEPAAALDPLARRELLREIVDMAGEQGATVIVSTHIVSDLERIASHVALLHQGRLRLHAELDGLKDEVRRIHLPAGTALPDRPLAGELARHPVEGGGWNLTWRADPAAAPDPAWQPAGGAQRVTLEDLFVEMAR